jgi:hypothetical protein
MFLLANVVLRVIVRFPWRCDVGAMSRNNEKCAAIDFRGNEIVVHQLLREFVETDCQRRSC